MRKCGVVLLVLPLGLLACGSSGSDDSAASGATGASSGIATSGSGGGTTSGTASGTQPVADAAGGETVSDATSGSATGVADSAAGSAMDGSRPAANDAGRAADASVKDATTGGSTDAGAGAGSGDGSVDPCGSSNPAVVPLPVIGSQTFSVTTYGAKGDGTTDDTTALQAALTAATAAGGGTVTVPSGTFLSGPIVVGSGTNLQLATGAELEMLPMGSWPGTTPFITASGAHDIALTGSGTIEGQGQAWWNALTATPTLVRPQEVSFGNSTRVLISGIHLQNPPEEHIWVKGDTDVTITGITINTVAVAGQHIPNNTDGVDIGAKGVFFCNNSITCGDDNVVMSGSNIYVAYSNFGVGHGCTIGSITESGVSNVTVDHITMTGTTAGIRLKSARDRGGLVNGLSYSNITMKNVTDPIFIASYYPTLPTDPTVDTAMAITATTPIWENITIKNVTAVGSANAGILWGLPEEKIMNVVFDNVNVQGTTGMEIFHASGISFTNGSVITATTGSAVTTDDATVTGITTKAF